MSTINITAARAVADAAEGQLLACVEIEAEPERVFRALTSGEITAWWVRPGVFDTREWSGDVRMGGRWRAAGVSRGQPYVQEGEFLKIEPPHKLIHTWEGAGKPEVPSSVTPPIRVLPVKQRDNRSAFVCAQRFEVRFAPR
jgi:uncharacterized protein YndB with AHSA1/START domain